MSTYRANRLLFIGVGHEGRLKIHERLFDRPMGLFSKDQTLWMAGRCHLWRFDNILTDGHEHEGADRLYVPAASFLTGEVNAHELIIDRNDAPLFVNTVFSCLAQLEIGCSFKPTWQPAFIDNLVPEDRCHLNGLAMKDGVATWATACSSGNTPTDWRRQRVGGGVVIQIPTGEIVCRELTMPHSPRWHGGRLWVLNSGTGELGWIISGTFQPLCALPGFVRGLAFHGGCAIVGLSKLRSPIFTGLPVEERLSQTMDSPQGSCGLRVVDLSNGKILHSLDLPEPIDELFDLALLPNVREPRALGLKDDSIDCLVKLPQLEELVQIHPTKPSGQPHQGPNVERLGLPQPEESQQANNPTELRYQRVYQLTPATLAPYASLTFPSLKPGSNAVQRIRGELLGISANHKGQMVGLVIAECHNQQQAFVVSLMVKPEWQRKGIGTRLLAHLSLFLQREGLKHLSVRYQASLQGGSTMSRLLKRLNWQKPQQEFLLLQGQANQLAQIDWRERFPLPNSYVIVPWTSNYAEASASMIAPPELKAAINSKAIASNVSLALLHNNQLVGWIIADHTDQNALRYSSLFVEPIHRQRGQSLHLLAAAFHRQNAEGIPIARAAVAPNNEAMKRLTTRHLIRYLNGVSQSMSSSIEISKNNSTADNKS